jgi:glycerol-3-phosphate dehydrogenase (NAD(P)+)
MNVVVLGSGSWGTALSILLARNGHDVTLLGRSAEEIHVLGEYRENIRYLPGFAVPATVKFGMIADGVAASDLVVLALPSAAVREVTQAFSGIHPIFAVASKGLEPGSAMFMADVVKQIRPEAETGVLSGPNLAVEIARGVPTVALAAFSNPVTADLARDAFSCGTFRVSTTDDVIGVELAGALKNVLSIGAGMSDGLGFGDNTKGAFLSRGLMEMARLGLAMGGRIETFLGPAGVGDLFATAVSSLSRNYRLGKALGQGQTLENALEEIGQVAEGAPTSEAVQSLVRRYDVEAPVFAAVESVIRGKVPPRKAVGMLMERSPKMDHFLDPQTK